jgi:aspartyl-tRNA(Asn)/glutamyl-tRNA(Gln) amidotransferase subunit C
MKIDNELVDKLAELAKLEFDETAKAETIINLNRMVAMISKIDELDLKGILPLKYITSEQNVWREDIIDSEITKAEILQNAPVKDSDYIKVPKVLK